MNIRSLIIRRVFLALIALFLPVTAYSSASDLVLKDLSLDLSVDYAGGSLGGTATLTIENMGPDSLARIPLQLGRLMTVRSVSDGSGEAIPFSQDVVRYPDWTIRQVVSVDVDLSAPLPPAGQVTISVEYDGILVGYAETGMRYIQDVVSPDFTLIRADALAFPQIGGASLAALRAQQREDFTFDAVIFVPDLEQIVATGVPGQKTGVAGGAEWRFQSETRVPFLNIAIAPYTALSGHGVTVYAFPEDKKGGEKLLGAAETTMRQYSEWFGPLDSGRTLSIIEIPDGWGSQASLAGGIIQSASSFRDGDKLDELFHELAHLWHPVELDQPSDRWNEGFATFLSWRMMQVWDPEQKLGDRAEAAAQDALKHYSGTDSRVPMSEFGDRNMTGRSYRIGALLFYILHEALGSDEFDALTRHFFSDHRTVGALNEDWAEALGQSKRADIERVFEEWAYTTQWVDRLETEDNLAAVIASYASDP